MTLEQVAERLHCSVKTVRRRINDGELRASRIARGRWEIRDEDLDAYLDAAATRPRPVRPMPPSAPIAPSTSRRARRANGGHSGRLEITNDMGRAA